MKRVRCPECKTAIINQIKEEKNTEQIIVTFKCFSCDIEFKQNFTN